MDRNRQPRASGIEGEKPENAARAFGRLIRRLAVALGGLILVFAGLPVLAAQPYRVLILDQGDLSGNYQMTHVQAVRAALTEILPKAVEIYSEGLDIERFPQPAHQTQLMHWLRQKYRDRSFNAIVTLGPESLDFAIRFRQASGITAPIVFTAIEEYYVGRMALPPGVTGVAVMSSFADTIKLARQLVPAAKKIIVLGDAETQAGHLMDISREFIEISMKQEINVMTGMPVAMVREHISNLPKDTAIVYLGITNDSTGQYFLPDQLLSELAKVANRPIFVTNRAFVGQGAAGGLVWQPTDAAHEVAAMTRRIMVDGEDASAIPVFHVDPRVPVFDARILDRFKMDRSRLPTNSEVLFQEAGMWERYSRQIIAVALAFVIQTGLIVGLISEYRRRRRIELRFRRSMSDFAHLNRATALGELSASIAHELNQPLAAILSNVESAQLLLDAEPPVVSEAQEALADALRENQRASDIIRSMRTLFRKGEFAPVACNLNDLLCEVMRFLGWEARAKQVAVVAELAEDFPLVLADKTQLQQVVLNLLMNAIEAAQHSTAADGGRVLVGSRRIDAKRGEVYVSDNGPGIAEDHLEKVFDPHYTTKASGMGMGLSICRAIAEAHGSRLELHNSPGHGCRFSLVLSAAEVP